MDGTNKYGYVFFTFGNCLVVLDDKALIEIFENAKPIGEVKPHYFKVIIKQNSTF